MTPTSFIQPRDLSDNEMARCEEALQGAYVVIAKWSNHFFGDRAIKKFRLHYFSNTWQGKKEIPIEDQKLIESVRDILDTHVLPGFGKLMIEYAGKFANGNRLLGATFEDAFQDVCMAATDAAYGYSGESCLSTHITTAIKNRLNDRWKATRKRCDNTVQSQIEDEANPIVVVDERDAEQSPEDKESVEMMFRAANDDFDKALVQAYLDNVPGFQTAVAAEFKKTRAAGNQRWAKIVQRLRSMYELQAA